MEGEAFCWGVSVDGGPDGRFIQHRNIDLANRFDYRNKILDIVPIRIDPEIFEDDGDILDQRGQFLR